MSSAPASTRVGWSGRRPLSVVATVLVVVAGLLFAAVPPAADAARVRADLERLAEELYLDLHDEARGAGRSLAEYRDMREVARDWSDEMAARHDLSHNPDYATQLCCHRRVGENIAWYQMATDLDAENVRRVVTSSFEQLMASEGHRANIDHPDYGQIGIGVTFRWDGTYWNMWATMVFRQADGTEPDAGIPTPRDIRDTCGTDIRPSFPDVPAGSAHASTIACIENHGITDGKADGTFGPAVQLTRGQVATFLLRTLKASGATAPEGRPCSGSPHAASMSAMIEWGVFESGSCDGGRTVGRSEMAVWSIRAMQGPLGLSMPEVQWDHFFDDNNLSGTVQGSHNAIAELGVVTGVGNEKFAPESWLRRDQMATFLARILDAAKDA